MRAPHWEWSWGSDGSSGNGTLPHDPSATSEGPLGSVDGGPLSPPFACSSLHSTSHTWPVRGTGLHSLRQAPPKNVNGSQGRIASAPIEPFDGDRLTMTTTAIQDEYSDDVSHCYGCGRLNHEGLPIRSFWDRAEAKAKFTPSAHHTAIPG